MGQPVHSPAVPSVTDSPPVEAQAQSVLRKHDVSSRYRLDQDLGWWRWVVGALALALTGFQLYTALFGSRPTLIQGAIHVGAAMGLVFLLYPAHKRLSDRTQVTKRVWHSLLALDGVLAALAMAMNFYIVAQYDRLTGIEVRILGYTSMDTWVAVLGVLLILEATRRCVGLPIVIIAGVALAYFWLGNYFPIFSHAGSSWENVALQTFFTSRSIFGTPIQVSSTFVFLFLLFGVLLIHTNIGAYFNGLAFRATGRFAGGPAKAAVVASAFQGTVTGSSVANTVASGSFTIPMMKRVGFKPTFAAGTEAAASTGGQIMPPVMGAAVFIMAEYTGVPYGELIIIAIIPALLYFGGVFLSVHFEAKRRGISGVDRSELPSLRHILLRMDLLLPLVVIIGMLLSGRTPANAALWGIVTAFVLSMVRASTRLTLTGILRVLEGGARVALPVIAACATAGIVAGTVTATGLGGQLAGGILDLAFGNFHLVLVFTMIACLLIGLGLPTTANYVVTATIAAPILLTTFDVPMVAAHMFVFYFGLLADITPPVCLAAYAASGIARSNPMRSGVTALRIAVAGFIIPYVFVLQPGLLLQDVVLSEVIPALVTAILGMMAIAAGLAGYLVTHATLVERIVLVPAGVALVYPSVAVSLPGLIVLCAVIVLQWLRRRNQAGRSKLVME